MVVLDDDCPDKDNGGQLDIQQTNVQMVEIGDSVTKGTHRKYADTLIWLIVLFGIFLFFPVGFIALYFVYTARIEFHAEQITSAMSRAYIAKLLSLVAIVLGMIWIGLLIGLTVWS